MTSDATQRLRHRYKATYLNPSDVSLFVTSFAELQAEVDTVLVRGCFNLLEIVEIRDGKIVFESDLSWNRVRDLINRIQDCCILSTTEILPSSTLTPANKQRSNAQVSQCGNAVSRN